MMVAPWGGARLPAESEGLSEGPVLTKVQKRQYGSSAGRGREPRISVSQPCPPRPDCGLRQDPGTRLLGSDPVEPGGQAERVGSFETCEPPMSRASSLLGARLLALEASRTLVFVNCVDNRHDHRGHKGEVMETSRSGTTLMLWCPRAVMSSLQPCRGAGGGQDVVQVLHGPVDGPPSARSERRFAGMSRAKSRQRGRTRRVSSLRRPVDNAPQTAFRAHEPPDDTHPKRPINCTRTCLHQREPATAALGSDLSGPLVRYNSNRILPPGHLGLPSTTRTRWLEQPAHPPRARDPEQGQG